jgi:alpha-glucosidase
MVADYPTAYRGHPGLAALAAIPTTWDDTKFLDGKVGEFVILARRSGAEWYVGAMTDAKARTLAVPLGFLGPGSFTAESWFDDDTSKHGLSHRLTKVITADKLTLELRAAGGALVRLVPFKQ